MTPVYIENVAAVRLHRSKQTGLIFFWDFKFVVWPIHENSYSTNINYWFYSTQNTYTWRVRTVIIGEDRNHEAANLVSVVDGRTIGRNP